MPPEYPSITQKVLILGTRTFAEEVADPERDVVAEGPLHDQKNAVLQGKLTCGRAEGRGNILGAKPVSLSGGRSTLATCRGLQLRRLSWASDRPNVRRPQLGG